MAEQTPECYSRPSTHRSGEGDTESGFELVLVVDQDSNDTRTLTRLIESRDRHALTAPSADDAMYTLEREPIDVIVLGLGERDVSGFRLISAIRHRREFDQIPLLVMPERDEPAAISLAIDLGANAVLPKPLNPALVWMLLDSATEQARRTRANGPPESRPEHRCGNRSGRWGE